MSGPIRGRSNSMPPKLPSQLGPTQNAQNPQRPAPLRRTQSSPAILQNSAFGQATAPNLGPQGSLPQVSQQARTAKAPRTQMPRIQGPPSHGQQKPNLQYGLSSVTMPQQSINNLTMSGNAQRNWLTGNFSNQGSLQSPFKNGPISTQLNGYGKYGITSGNLTTNQVSKTNIPGGGQPSTSIRNNLNFNGNYGAFSGNLNGTGDMSTQVTRPGSTPIHAGTKFDQIQGNVRPNASNVQVSSNSTISSPNNFNLTGPRHTMTNLNAQTNVQQSSQHPNFLQRYFTQNPTSQTNLALNSTGSYALNQNRRFSTLRLGGDYNAQLNNTTVTPHTGNRVSTTQGQGSTGGILDYNAGMPNFGLGVTGSYQASGQGQSISSTPNQNVAPTQQTQSTFNTSLNNATLQPRLGPFRPQIPLPNVNVTGTSNGQPGGTQLQTIQFNNRTPINVPQFQQSLNNVLNSFTNAYHPDNPHNI